MLKRPWRLLRLREGCLLDDGASSYYAALVVVGDSESNESSTTRDSEVESTVRVLVAVMLSSLAYISSILILLVVP